MERALQMAYEQWRAGVHDCGHPLSETIIDKTAPPGQAARWRAGYQECAACLALEKALAVQQAKDSQVEKATGAAVPWRHRVWRIDKIGSETMTSE